MKKLFFIFILCTHLPLKPDSLSKERHADLQRKFAEKRKPKKAVVKMGTSGKAKVISENAPLVLLDQIQAVVTTIAPEKAQIVTTVITMQDITRQGFDGGQYSTDDLIDSALMDHLSQAFKVNVTNDDINRYCQKMNLSVEQLQAIADNWWFPSLDSFYELFKKNYRGRMAMNFLVDSQIVISEEEIEQYWKNNPVWLEPVYFVETLFIPFNGKSLEELQEEIADKEKRNKLSDLHWNPSSKVLESEIDSNNNFIFELAIGDSFLKPDADGVLLYRLQNKLPKREKSLPERKNEISNKLKMERTFLVEDQEKQKLRNNALIYKSTFEAPATTKELVEAVK